MAPTDHLPNYSCNSLSVLSVAPSVIYSLRPPDSKGALSQSACNVGGTVVVPPVHAAAVLYSSMNARLSTRAIYMPGRCGKVRVASELMRKLKVTFLGCQAACGLGGAL